jgi:hypothetical protein
MDNRLLRPTPDGGIYQSPAPPQYAYATVQPAQSQDEKPSRRQSWWSRFCASIAGLFAR